MSRVQRDERKKQQLPSRPRMDDVGYTADEVKRHATVDDGWIVINDRVYDISNFIKHHPGWTHGGQTSTILAIQRNLGKECSEEFAEIHNKNAWRQLDGYMIGYLWARPASELEEAPPELPQAIACT
mmetsp:Transcript_42749/g.137779  ORF Transcript_42749/g.137779 Transcript_42749/m.137779 type:complete len:127 (-) Transcript_42749:91-471(-)